MADVDDEEGVPVAVGEELLVDPGRVEAGHRTRGQAEGTDGEDEVSGLKRSVERGDGLAPGGLALEVLLHLRADGQDVREVLVEAVVHSEDRDDGRRGRLRPVSLVEVRQQALLALGRTDVQNAQRLGARGGRLPSGRAPRCWSGSAFRAVRRRSRTSRGGARPARHGALPPHSGRDGSHAPPHRAGRKGGPAPSGHAGRPAPGAWLDSRRPGRREDRPACGVLCDNLGIISHVECVTRSGHKVCSVLRVL